jgi:hypothetical protein
MVPTADRLRTAFAVLLLLVQALLPGAHRLQHALADARAHEAEPCACGHRHEDAAGLPTSGPELRAGHAHGAHDCAICQLLTKVRHWLPSGEPAVAVAAVPIDLAPVAIAPALPDLAELPSPPARGPPVT